MAGFVEKRGPGRWRARYRGPDARERSRTFERRIDAERWLSTVAVSMTRGEWTDPARARVLFSEWAEQWLIGRAPSLKATTRESYRSLLDTCILPTWGRVRLSSVAHADVVAWVADLSTRVGPSRCRKAATLLSGMMAGAVRDQRIPRNPCEGVRLPRLPHQEQRYLTLEQLQDLAEAAGPYRLMFLVLGICGLRFGECAALTVRAFDPLRRRLRVFRAVSDVNGQLVWSTPKTHQARDVPVPRFLAEQLVADVAGRSPDALMFTSPTGEPLRIGNWRRRVWDPALAAAGLGRLTPHDLRHTAASLAIASGASVKHVQRMLGHKDAAMTLNVYASLFDDDLDTVSDRLDAAVSAAAAASVRPEQAAPVVDLGRHRKQNAG